MELKSLHIEHFGGLSDLSLEFSPGLNVILRDNGWGKSTLAAFILVMFYGFGGEGRRSELDNERRRWKPWAAEGAYGGQLTFALKGKCWRIERIFGAREKEDSFRLFDTQTGLESKAYSSNIGEEIFRIDRESWIRTVFAGQMDLDSGATAEIHAQIGGLAAYDADMGQCDTVLLQMKKEADHLTPYRKTGLIARKRSELEEWENTLRGEEQLLDTAKQLRRRQADNRVSRQRLAKADEALSERIRLASARQDQKAKEGERQQAHRSLQEAVFRAQKQWQEAGGFFTRGLPAVDRLEELRRVAADSRANREMAESLALSVEEQARLDDLIRKFHTGLPREEELKQLEERGRRIDALRHWMEQAALTEEEQRIREEGRQHFAQYLPDGLEIDRMLHAWSDREKTAAVLESERRETEARRALLEKAADADIRAAGLKVRRKKRTLMILSLLLMAFGLGLSVYLWQQGTLLQGLAAASYPALSAFALIGIGCLLLVLSMMQKPVKAEMAQRNASGRKLRDTLEPMETELKRKEAQIQAADLQVEDFLDRTGYPAAPRERMNALLRLRELAGAYVRVREKFAAWQAKQPVESMERMLREQIAWTASYEPSFRGNMPAQAQDTDWSAVAAGLRKDMADYEALTARYARGRKCREQMRGGQQQIAQYLGALGFAPNAEIRQEPSSETSADEDPGALLDRIRDQMQLVNRLKEEWETKKAELADWEKRENWGRAERTEAALRGEREQTLEELNADREELHRKTEEMTREAAGLDRQSESVGEQLENLREIRALKDGGREELARMEKRYRIVTDTARLLTKARDRLTARYMGPITDAYNHYWQLLTGERQEKWSADARLAFRLHLEGADRDPMLLSAGKRDLAGLCGRLALVDAMYREERPMLLLDDPFVNLDDERQRRGLEFLEKAGKEYQIICFTCHSYMEERRKTEAVDSPAKDCV